MNWGVTYDFGEELEGVVISVTPCIMYDNYYLLVGVTNLYNKDISFSANAQAKDASDNIVGDGFFFNTCIGAGNTAINLIDCGDNTPDGRISWSDVEVGESYRSYVAWEADYAVSGNPNDSYLTVDYEMYATDGSRAFEGDLVTVLLLDEHGFVVGVGTDYGDETAPGSKYIGSTNIYADAASLSLTKDVAIFANPFEP